MKHFELTVSIAFVLLLASGCCTQHIDEVVRISIAQHTRRPLDLRCAPLEVDVDYVEETGLPNATSLPVDFFVIIENKSKDTLCFDSEAFSWGYANLSLLIQTTGESIFVARKRNRAWTRNIPEVDVLPAGESMAIPVCLDNAIWEGLPECKKGSTVRIGAVFVGGYILSPRNEVVSRIGPLQSRFYNIAIHDTRKTNWMIINYEQEMTRVKRGGIP